MAGPETARVLSDETSRCLWTDPCRLPEYQPVAGTSTCPPAHLAPAPDGRLGVRAFGANSFIQGLEVDDDGFTEVTETRQHLGTASFRHTLSDRFDYRLGFFGGDVARDSYYGGTAALGSPDPDSPYYDPTWTPERGYGDTDNQLYVAQGLGDWHAAADHVITAGVQWRLEELEKWPGPSTATSASERGPVKSAARMEDRVGHEVRRSSGGSRR